ncbi:Transcription antitermination protein NusB [bioreactor metagenome]|uniref:Transcription antitermination protein NusB n=1 Tax=bioreactor metagenome TaxID=1076179 RepID=A0A644UZ43_9ZZZZ
MSRRKAREVALQVLFQMDFNTAGKEEALDAVIAEAGDLSGKAQEYAQALVEGTQSKQEKIDEIIAGISSDWKVERMAGVDRNIVRIAIYEIKLSGEQIPPNVAINEAVELAKKFGTEESGRFVNGILGTLAKGQQK